MIIDEDFAADLQEMHPSERIAAIDARSRAAQQVGDDVMRELDNYVQIAGGMIAVDRNDQPIISPEVKADATYFEREMTGISLTLFPSYSRLLAGAVAALAVRIENGLCHSHDDPTTGYKLPDDLHVALEALAPLLEPYFTKALEHDRLLES